MTETALHLAPRRRDVWLEQVQAVGLGLRREAAGVAFLAALASVLVAAEGATIDFHPEHWVVAGLVGALLPLAVWKDEKPFAAGFLWALPVDRRGHALARVSAGWVWLMAAVALFVLWLLALALLTGGNVLGTETLRLLPSIDVPAPGTLAPAALRRVARVPEPLLWLVPFTAATATYLLSSALALGARHPARWLAGGVLAWVVVTMVGQAGNPTWGAAERVLEALLNGPFGLETLLVARTESLVTDVTLSTGERVLVWRALPNVGEWATATLLWTAAGLAALWAASLRHRERRRG